MSAVLAAALEYAEHGWPVLPVEGKRPSLPDWPNAASCDPAVIARWWHERPGLNVGLVTGPRSGLAVLDVDPRSGGTDSLGALERRVGLLPATVQSLTGGGGLHLLYAHPGHKVSSSAHQLGPGLDVKADGGMIVAPPSVHPGTGRAYRWFGDVWRDPLASWPAVLRPVVRAVPEPVQRPRMGSVEASPRRRLEGLVQTVMDACQGERNSRLHWAACRGGEMVAAGQVDRGVVGDALLLAAQAVGLGELEAVATIRSGLGSTLRVVA